MSAPPRPGTVRLFDALVPPLVPGRYTLKAQLTLTTTKGGLEPLALAAVGADGKAAAEGTIDVTAPRFRLDPAEIAAVYPRPDSAESPSNMLPHVMLRRRTLPWERPVEATRTCPWLAVLLFWPGEMELTTANLRSKLPGLAGASTGEQPGPTEQGQFATLTRAALRGILPRRAELPLLCHARRLDTHESASHHDEDGYVAYVIGNRLPKTVTAAEVASQKPQTACLVSLESIYADKGLWPEDVLQNGSAKVDLLVLHSWSFKVGVGGDFEAYWHDLAKAGGSRRFGEDLGLDGKPLANPLGQVAVAAPTAGAEGAPTERKVLYAGPFVGVPLDHDKHFVRSASEALTVTPDGKEVVSHAAAFELGRLLALSSPAALANLLSYRHGQLHKVPILPDDVQNPELVAIRKKLQGSFRDVLKGYLNGGGITGIPGFPGDPDPDWPDRRGADPTGVRHLVGAIGELTPEHLELGEDQVRARVVLGERWSEGDRTAFEASLGASLTLDAPALGASFDALFSENAALATKGAKR